MSFDQIPGWFDWESVYARWAREAPPGAVFVEVGVFLGRSCAYLCEQLRLAGNTTAIVYAVDPWQDDWRTPEQKTEMRFEGLPTWGGDLRDAALAKGGPFESFCWHMGAFAPGDFERVRVVRTPSVMAARMFDDESIDHVWLDGDHNYSAISADIAAWMPKVKRGNVLGGHDWSEENYPGVVRAVREAFGNEWQHAPSGTGWLAVRA